ncbi:MAG: mechanosensitive ion channel family protein [Myxococcota bacterium]
MKLLNMELFHNTLKEWVIALSTVIAVTILLYLVKKIAVKYFKSSDEGQASGVASIFSEILGRTKLLILFLVSLYAATFLLTLPSKAISALRTTAIIAGIIQLGLWGSYFVIIGVRQYLSSKDEEGTATSGISVISLVLRVIVWAAVLLLVLDNLGVNITTLIAGLGVGGIAIGLAVQNILGDLFASFSIILDKPFAVGEFIVVDNMPGTVERIGLKTTRVRSLNGELLIFGNNDLLKSRIRNFKYLEERRVSFNFGVVYAVESEKLKRIPDIVRSIIEGVEKTRFDRVHFKAFGNFSLDFEVVYYVVDPDYKLYMDTQQAINYALFDAFRKEGIEFAFPTQTIHLAKNDKN